MDFRELSQALTKHFASQGFAAAEEGDAGLDLVLSNAAERWGFALCPDREEVMAYLGVFEAAMQRLVDASRANPQIRLGLGLAFGSTAVGSRPSYRRALKKYSNSIVFEDLGLSLFLIKSENDIVILAPVEVNKYLRGLDRHVTFSTKDNH